MKMKMQWALFIIFATALFLVGCATSGQKATKEAPPTPVFDWNPPETAATASAGVTFGIVGGSYAKEEDWINVYPFDTFRDNMRNDFNELMTARGFTTTGPFLNADEMTYPDKKACDLVLEPTLDVQLTLGQVSAKEHIAIFGDNYFTLNGNATIGGRVTLSVVESLSGTRMWNKSVSIKQATFPWKGEAKYKVIPQTWYLQDEPGLQRAIAPHLEMAYNAILDKAWDYLHPEEMAVVAQQAAEVKEKTTFSGNK